MRCNYCTKCGMFGLPLTEHNGLCLCDDCMPKSEHGLHRSDLKEALQLVHRVYDSMSSHSRYFDEVKDAYNILMSLVDDMETEPQQ